MKSLAISGRDVMRLGVPQGPLVGSVLNEVLEAVIDEQVPNSADELVKFVETLIGEEKFQKKFAIRC